MKVYEVKIGETFFYQGEKYVKTTGLSACKAGDSEQVQFRRGALTDTSHQMCGRCYAEGVKTFPANCAEKPEALEARYGCRGPVLYFIAESKEKAQELYRECLNDEDIECENMED